MQQWPELHPCVSQIQGVMRPHSGPCHRPPLATVLPLPPTSLTKLPTENLVKGERVVVGLLWATLVVRTRVGGGGFPRGASLSPSGKPEVESTEAAAQASQG